MRKNQKPSLSSQNQCLVGGILIGALIGTGSALFINSRFGKKLKENLSDVYQDACDKVEDFTHHIAEKSEEVTQGVKDRFFKKPSSSHTPVNLLVGSIAGGILGISAFVLLNSDRSKGFKENLFHTFQCLTDKTHEIADDIGEATEAVVENFEDRLAYWVKVATKLIHNLSDASSKNVKEEEEEAQYMTLDKVVDWAVLGIRLFNSLKNRRN